MIVPYIQVRWQFCGNLNEHYIRILTSTNIFCDIVDIYSTVNYKIVISMMCYTHNTHVNSYIGVSNYTRLPIWNSKGLLYILNTVKCNYDTQVRCSYINWQLYIYKWSSAYNTHTWTELLMLTGVSNVYRIQDRPLKFQRVQAVKHNTRVIPLSTLSNMYHQSSISNSTPSSILTRKIETIQMSVMASPVYTTLINVWRDQLYTYITLTLQNV